MRDAGHADRYTKLRVEYVDHHNPDLFLFDSDGEEMQRIDLTRIKTLKNVHKLMQMLGMRETCKDANNDCASWADGGQCTANPDYMTMNCRKSCKICSEEAAVEEGGAASEGAEPRRKKPKPLKGLAAKEKRDEEHFESQVSQYKSQLGVGTASFANQLAEWM